MVDRLAYSDALFANYAVPAGHVDEMAGSGGEPAAAWRQFTAHAGPLTATRLARAQAGIERQLRENGVTYNVYAESRGANRPWAVDALPLVIPADEWEPLARGLRQRARVMNA